MAELPKVGLAALQEIPPSLGFHVAVQKQHEIYRSISRAAASGDHFRLIQDDEIADLVCMALETKMVCYDHQSSYNPGTYEFDSEVVFEGRKASRLVFQRGYYSQEQVEQMVKLLETCGYKGGHSEQITIITTEEGTRTVEFMDKDNRRYYVSMGFPDTETHLRWIDNRIAQEEAEGRRGYYTVFGEKEKGNLFNDNLVFHSQPLKYPEGLPSGESFTFAHNLSAYTQAYEDFLSCLYKLSSVDQPNKVLTIRPE